MRVPGQRDGMRGVGADARRRFYGRYKRRRLNIAVILLQEHEKMVQVLAHLDQEQLARRAVYAGLSARVDQQGPPELSHQGGVSWKAVHKNSKHGELVSD
jgi:hypothetical protein